MWIEMTIAGFVYVTAGFILIVSCIPINNLSFLSHVSAYAPYASVALVFLSNVIGYSAHQILEILYSLFKWIRDKVHKSMNRQDIQNDHDKGSDLILHTDVPDRVIEHVKSTYSTFVLFRHLSIGFILLLLSLWHWNVEVHLTMLRSVSMIICALLAFLCIVTYCCVRPILIQLNDDVQKKWPREANT